VLKIYAQQYKESNMKLRMALDDKMLDLRLRDRLVSEGKVTKTQVDEFLGGLSDEEGNYIYVGEKKETTTSTTEQ
jgi:hypothetical protein